MESTKAMNSVRDSTRRALTLTYIPISIYIVYRAVDIAVVQKW